MSSSWDVATFIGLVLAVVVARRLWNRGPAIAIAAAVAVAAVCSAIGYFIDAG